MSLFNLSSKYKPAGDQAQAIDKLVHGLGQGMTHQTLLGVTGSGKTFTMANIIAQSNKPAMILAHNKTLAAQLFAEFSELFPENAVRYFVSYYDYYQPEAYVPSRDLYIEKESDINQTIERYRNAATQALLTRPDTIIVASVSCIYGLGNPESYLELSRELKVGMNYSRNKLLRHLTDMQYQRSEYDFYSGLFRVRGDVIDVYLAYDEAALRIEYFGDEIESLKLINPINGEVLQKPDIYKIFPAKQFVTAFEALKIALPKILADLEIEVKNMQDAGKLIEAQRLKQRVMYDIEMLQETGYCNGIENYSRYIENRAPGSPPSTLIDYFPDDWLLLIDESHISVPQIRGMFNGDQARKTTLVDYGFRLQAAKDNRPLKFEEFRERVNQVIYVSATPSEYELNLSRQNASQLADKLPKNYQGIAEQLIRPTGLIDPLIQVRPIEKIFMKSLQESAKKFDVQEIVAQDSDFGNQIDDLIHEVKKVIAAKQRVLVTTLTKRMAEELTAFLSELSIKVQYIHSDVDTVQRVELLRDLRLGKYDVLVGINLLREGLDLPEVSLVAIMDADKEGFLRSHTSLIQTIGRAARHLDGRVIMYANKITGSMHMAISETLRRRKIQVEYNKKHGITPQSIIKSIQSLLENETTDESNKPDKRLQSIEQRAESYSAMSKAERIEFKADAEIQMNMYADMLEFEKAAEIRDLLKKLVG